jgi:hypothetical protein
MVPEPQSGSLDLLAAALAAFQAEVPTVTKTHTATVRSEKGAYEYSYADLADVTEAALPLLAKHGLAFTCLPTGKQLVGMLLHSSGQMLTARLPIYGSTPQQIGSELTYMRRYLLGCMTGLVTDDDDDGQAATPSKPTPGARKRAQARVAADPTPHLHPSPEPLPETPNAKTGSGGITNAQIRKMGALMRDAGLDRAGALAYVADTIGHPVTSRSELTVREASQVIDALVKDTGGDYSTATADPTDPDDPWRKP